MKIDEAATVRMMTDRDWEYKPRPGNGAQLNFKNVARTITWRGPDRHEAISINLDHVLHFEKQSVEWFISHNKERAYRHYAHSTEVTTMRLGDFFDQLETYAGRVNQSRAAVPSIPTKTAAQWGELIKQGATL